MERTRRNVTTSSENKNQEKFYSGENSSVFNKRKAESYSTPKKRHLIEVFNPAHFSKRSIDDECSKKDRVIAMMKVKMDDYKRKLLEYKELSTTLTNQNERLHEELNNKNLMNEELEKRNNFLVKCQITSDKEKDKMVSSLNAQKFELEKKLVENQKQLNNAQEVNKCLKNSLSEATKRSETVIHKLKADITELNNKFKAKTEEVAEGIHDMNQTIEKLQNEVKCKAISSDRYKAMFEKCRREYMSIKEMNKKLITVAGSYPWLLGAWLREVGGSG